MKNKQIFLLPLMLMVLLAKALAYTPPSPDNVALVLATRTASQSPDNVVLILDYQAASATNSCSYAAPGNYRVNLSDGCNITTNIIVNGGFETYGGPGYASITGNITNVSFISLTSVGANPGCTPTTCMVRCIGLNGVCIRN